jgi:hypothetical protein
VPEIQWQEEIGSPATKDHPPQESTSDQPKASPGGPIGLPRRIRDVTLKLENLYHRPQVFVSVQRLGNDDKNLPVHAILQQIPKNRAPEHAQTMTANVAFQLRNCPLQHAGGGQLDVGSVLGNVHHKIKKGKRYKNRIINGRSGELTTRLFIHKKGPIVI